MNRKLNNRVILKLKMTFDSEFFLHTRPSMYGNFWCMLGDSVGGLNTGDSISIHDGSNSFGHAKRC